MTVPLAMQNKKKKERDKEKESMRIVLACVRTQCGRWTEAGGYLQQCQCMVLPAPPPPRMTRVTRGLPRFGGSVILPRTVCPSTGAGPAPAAAAEEEEEEVEGEA